MDNETRMQKIGRSIDKHAYTIMVIPAIVLALVVSIWPSLQTILYSFQQYKLLVKTRKFIGFDNYKRLFTSSSIKETTANTAFFSLVSVAVAVLLALFTAAKLVKDYPGKGFFRAMFLVPWVTPPIAASFMWKILYNENFSPINSLLLKLGWIKTPINFLGDTTLFCGFLSVPLIMITIVNIWSIFPFLMVMFIAALQTVPSDLYEAAAIDGAGPIKRFWLISVPIIRPMVSISVLLEFVWQFNGFNVSYLVTSGGPLEHTKLLAVEVYNQAWKMFDYGYSSTVSCFMLLLISIPAIIYIRSTVKSSMVKPEGK